MPAASIRLRPPPIKLLRVITNFVRLRPAARIRFMTRRPTRLTPVTERQASIDGWAAQPLITRGTWQWVIVLPAPRSFPPLPISAGRLLGWAPRSPTRGDYFSVRGARLRVL